MGVTARCVAGVGFLALLLGLPPSSTTAVPPPAPGATLAAGAVLVASRGLSDPNFRRSVVLLLSHGSGGALGLVMNRPSALTLAEALPEVPELTGRPELVHIGGPVAVERVTLLLRLSSPPEQAERVFADVYASASLQTLRRFLAEGGAGVLRAYAGYAGWAAGQLEREVERGDWHVASVEPDLLFERPAERVWPELMRRVGGVWVWAPQPSLVVAHRL